jgi:Flp pilus assembly pilin Flp
VSSSFAGFESIPALPVDSVSSRTRRAAEDVEGGESMFSFTDLIHYLRARYQVEEGQTMAEYGVVLAVLALGVVVALGLLSGAISGAIDRVRGIL